MDIFDEREYPRASTPTVDSGKRQAVCDTGSHIHASWALAVATRGHSGGTSVHDVAHPFLLHLRRRRLTGCTMSATSTHPAVPTSLINTTEDAAALSFNISFSLNLGSLLHVPSRLFARMRRLDDIFGMHSEIDSANSLGASSEGTSLIRRMRGEHPPPPGGLTPLPGPWAFFASGYAVALFAMVSTAVKYTCFSMLIT